MYIQIISKLPFTKLPNTEVLTAYRSSFTIITHVYSPRMVTVWHHVISHGDIREPSVLNCLLPNSFVLEARQDSRSEFIGVCGNGASAHETERSCFTNTRQILSFSRWRIELIETRLWDKKSKSMDSEKICKLALQRCSSLWCLKVLKASPWQVSWGTRAWNLYP